MKVQFGMKAIVAGLSPPWFGSANINNFANVATSF